MNRKDQQIEELIEHNNDLENYFRNTIIPQLFIDADLILKKYTPPAMKQFSLHGNDVGKSMIDIKDNFRFPTIIEDIKQVIECNEILEKEIQTTDLRWYQMNIIPYVEFKSKKTNGVIITFVEITMRIRDLKLQESLVSDHEILLDTISHDIKSPLTSLIVSIDLFKTASPADEQEFPSLLKIVDNSARKMQDIINELTDTRKAEHKYRDEVELINFANILEDVRLTLMDKIIETAAVIKNKINVPEMIYSKRKLRSIIYNLVNNAIKFKSPELKPKIFITITREKGFIIISVKDNGIGIDKSKLDNIFSKYYRVENAVEGSGIGLYLVREIVNNSGGKILVESQPGMGSLFRVYLKPGKNHDSTKASQLTKETPKQLSLKK